MDYCFDPPEIEIIFDNKTYQFEINKTSRSKAVDVYNFYDHYLKEKDLQLFILHIKILLKMESLTKKRTNLAILEVVGKNNKDFIQKEIYFNKSRLVSKIKKKNDDKNMIFLKYRDKIYLFKLEITKPYIAKFSDATDK